MALRTLLVSVLLGSIWRLAGAQNQTTKEPVSTLYNDELDTTFSINVPDNSEDINFFLSSELSSWFGVGFSSSMDGSPMLLFYSSADGKDVTVSPRYSTGDTEPAYNSTMKVTMAGSSANNGTFIVAGTCSGCKQWSGVPDAQPFIMAWGADTDPIASDDLSVRLKQHDGYAHFTMDIGQATGPGGTDMLLGLAAATNSTGAQLVGGLVADTSNHGGLAHGVLMAVATLVIAPIDVLTAGLLGRWPVLHMMTSSVMTIFLLVGMGLGIQMSRLYIATQHYRTAHQILGLFAIVALFLVALLGVFYRFVVRSAARRGQQPPEKSWLLGKVHRWVGWVVWVIMLVNNGLGLQFAEENSLLIIGYSVLAAGVLILVGLIRWSIWFCKRRSLRDDEEDKAAIELAQLYASSQPAGHGAGQYS